MRALLVLAAALLPPAALAAGDVVTASPTPAVRDVEVAHGATLRVVERGAGRPVVFLHGFALDHREWDEETAALNPRYRTIAYDLRAHGGSSPALESFSHLDELGAVLDALSVSRATLVGLSAGARIALDFALAHPERVEALVLASPAVSGRPPEWPMPWFGAIVEAVRSGEFERAAGLFADSPLMATHGGPDAAERARRIVIDNAGLWRSKGQLERPLDPPAHGRLAEIRVPVLAIAGALDPSDSPAAAREIAAQVAGAELLVIDGAGHLVDFDAPETFLATLERFLERTAPLP